MLGAKAKTRKKRIKTTLELFTVLKPTEILVRETALLQFKDYQSLEEERMKAIIEIQAVQNSMNELLKEVTAKCDKRRSKARDLQYSRTNTMPFIFFIGDYVKACRSVGRSHNLNASWHGLVKVFKVMAYTAFQAQSITWTIKEIIYAQRLARYSAKKAHQSASDKILTPVQHLHNSNHVIESIQDLCKKKGKDKFMVRWLARGVDG